MNINKLYHNPKCSKSRETLELLNTKNISFEVVEYLKTSISTNDLEYICEKLNVNPIDIIRIKEKTFSDLGLSKNDNKTSKEWFKIMNENPILIERPIFVYNEKVAVGRPPENVLSII